jgi:ligand-binding sensor domain-containing protein
MISVFDRPFWDHWSTEKYHYEFVDRSERRVPAIGIPHHFFHDRQDRVWVAGSEGVACYTHGLWQSWSQQSGLLGQGCWGILEDEDGRIWISTGRSLSYYHEEPQSYR